ncbi:hypothetical protein ABW19_dt0207355 [Dactylella cylindrospora]|nr:hypothetical protein ABW19_dt0207355 [Dactylella cylindrospora]
MPRTNHRPPRLTVGFPPPLSLILPIDPTPWSQNQFPISPLHPSTVLHPRIPIPDHSNLTLPSPRLRSRITYILLHLESHLAAEITNRVVCDVHPLTPITWPSVHAHLLVEFRNRVLQEGREFTREWFSPAVVAVRPELKWWSHMGDGRLPRPEVDITTPLWELAERYLLSEDDGVYYVNHAEEYPWHAALVKILGELGIGMAQWVAVRRMRDCNRWFDERDVRRVEVDEWKEEVEKFVREVNSRLIKDRVEALRRAVEVAEKVTRREMERFEVRMQPDVFTSLRARL